MYRYIFFLFLKVIALKIISLKYSPPAFLNGPINFESGIFNEQIDKIAQEGARDHGLLNVSVIDFFDRLEVMQPQKKEEQQKIVSCLSVLDDLITAQAEKLEQLKQHKKGLMQRLFPKAID